MSRVDAQAGAVRLAAEAALRAGCAADGRGYEVSGGGPGLATAGERVASRRGSLGFLARELGPQVPALLDEVGG